jgi:hypothetical protein
MKSLALRRRRPRRAGSLAALVLAALIVVPSASSVDGIDHYTAQWPSGTLTVPAGQDATFTLRVTNCPTSNPLLAPPCGASLSLEPISRVTLKLPQGLIANPDSAPTATGWGEGSVEPLPDQLRDVIVLSAPSGDELLPGQSMTVTFHATPHAVGAYTIETSATGVTGGEMTFVGGQPTVNAVAPVPEEGTIVSCGSSGMCEGQASDGKTTVSVTATGTDHGDLLTVALIARETEQCQDFAGAEGSKGGAFYVVDDDFPRSEIDLRVTWKLDGKTANITDLNGRTKFNICFGGRSKQDPSDTFTTKSGSESTQIAGVQWGILPDCGPNFTEPCVSSRKKGSNGDVTVTFEVPSPWDPTAYGGP